MTRRLFVFNCLAWLGGAALGGAALGGCRHGARSGPTTAPTMPPTLPAQFTDITEAAGLSFIQGDGECGMNYFPEQFAAGAALLDANGDGFLDIYFPAPKPLGPAAAQARDAPPLRQRLYRNDGKGGFRLVPNAFGGTETDYAVASAVGDYDNDGHPDLYVCCAGRDTLYRNRGDGTFEDVTEQAGVGLRGLSTGAVWFDYDGDGLLDLYVSRYCDWTLRTDIACPGPHGERLACHPEFYTPSTGVLYHNNGDGTFTDVTRRAGVALKRGRGLGVAAADFDGDGRLDLFVANDIGPNFLYHNNGDGTFEEVALREGCAFGLNGQNQANMGVAVGDYLGDGRLSVLVTTFSNEPYTLYRNDGGYFTDVSVSAGIAGPTRPFLGFGAGFFDARNNGLLDVFFANGHVYSDVHAPQTYRQPNQFFLNDGAGHFQECPAALPAQDVRVHRGACFGDLNNDGRIDILVTSKNDRPTLLRNDSPQANWLLLRLTDKHGCATPVGARCVAVVNGKRLTRVLLGGGSYGGDGDPRVHFGLGAAPTADIEVHWLSGHVQALQGVKANQILSVQEEVSS